MSCTLTYYRTFVCAFAVQDGIYEPSDVFKFMFKV